MQKARLGTEGLQRIRTTSILAMALDGNARADEAREVRSGRWIGHNGDSTPRNSAYARRLKPCQYRAADNAAMELVNGTLLPNHIITSERYEPAAVRVLRSLRSAILHIWMKVQARLPRTACQ